MASKISRPPSPESRRIARGGTRTDRGATLVVASALFAACALVAPFGLTAIARADVPTPTPTSTVGPAGETTATPTPLAAPSAAPTARSEATAQAPPVPTPRRESKKRKHRTKRTQPPARQPTATATPTARVESRPRKKHAGRRRHRARPTATPTATPTPSLTLNAEDSVSPVQCNGSEKHPARKPFLYPPYRGWTSLVSYFDHDSPNFYQDGLVITATGVQAAPDGVHQRSDFPAYWNAQMRQYLYYDGHNGYDFDLWYQPVYAASSGEVIFAGYELPTMPDHGYGKMVMIQHRGGYVTLYGHFSRVLVKSGQKVRTGQQIGVSGNTGHSTGPHLHFTVFHNCTPTDPYGWSGQGPDPLSTYQGESSSYLWARPPDFLNPQNGWPGIARLPGIPTERIVLLRLPAAALGTAAFTAALKKEATRTSAAMRGYGGTITVDLLRAAVIVRSAVPFSRMYAVADVASITTPGTIEGDKTDVLAALARAALVTPRRAVALGASHRWSGYLLQWEGRTLLVGRGEKGKIVDLRLVSGKGGAQVKTLNADPKTGAYAIDLGALSRAQQETVSRSLQAAARAHASLRAHSRTILTHPASVHARRVRTHGAGWPWMGTLSLALIIAGALGAIGAVGWTRRYRLFGKRPSA